MPIRFSRDGAPCDLVVSPDHGLFVHGVLIPARLLLNGTSIRVETECRTVTWYHLELDSHDVLLAEGLPVESYLDTGDRASFENGGQPLQLHPEFSVRRWDVLGVAPLVVTGPELDAARHRVDIRASGGPGDTVDVAESFHSSNRRKG